MLKSMLFSGTLGLCILLKQLGTTHGTDAETGRPLPVEEAGEEMLVEGRGAYRPPPRHYTPKTIDQLIVEAYGGTDVVNQMPSRITAEGLVTAELDMNLTPQQFQQLYSQDERNRGKRKATSDVRTRWPNHVIPYEINYRDFSNEEVQEIKSALATWEKMTCVRFRPASWSDKNRIKFQNGPGCNSGLGMIGGSQAVNLQSPGCRYKGLYLHESGHAIGLVHEHQLPERDNYISIRYSNVAPTMRQWFNKYNEDAVDSMGVEYDYASVMHYGKTAFSFNGRAQTIFALDKSKEDLIGQVADKGLSFSDVKSVNLMYNCNAKCPAQPSCRSPCFVNKKCKCFCKDDMPKPPCVNKEGDQQCVEWASRGECDLNSNFMHPNCRKACGLCSGGSGSGTTDQGAGSKPKPEVCENSYGDKECRAWAGRGECRANPRFMNKNCRKACEKCKAVAVNTTPTPRTTPKPRTTTTPRTTTAKSKSNARCRNDYGDRRCNAWAARGECSNNPNFMHTSCRKACRRCASGSGDGGTTTTNSGSTCKDQNSGCSAWKTYCKSNAYVTKHCPKTCGTCSLAGPVAPKPKRPKGKGRGKGKDKGKVKGKGKGTQRTKGGKGNGRD